MCSRTRIVVAFALLGLGFPLMAVEDKPKPMPPNIAGEWTGVWGPFSPAEGAALSKDKCKALDCSVTRQGSAWEATFRGECGRPYKYTITMMGRPSGDSILFKGTTDLGEKDGGVYDWIGRATEQEFVGFYTSAGHTGAFHLSRKK